jgi:pimeloyl-ACP methyl ester carboxylesterase
VTTQRRAVSADGTRLAVQEWPSPHDDAETVVLVHGYPDTARIWDRVAPLLAADHRVVSYDGRGAGGSDRPATDADYRLDRLVEDAAAVCDLVSPERRVHLVGHDWGSVAGWAVAARLGHRVASFTSVSGPPVEGYLRWLRAGARDPRRWGAVLDQLARSGYIAVQRLPVLPDLGWRLLAPRWPDYLRATGVTDPPRPDTPTRLADALDGRRLYRANGRAGTGTTATGSGTTTTTAAAGVAVPVLLVVADRDPYLRADLVTAAAATAPRLTVARLDAGHWVPLSHPRELAGLVGGFVAEQAAPR